VFFSDMDANAIHGFQGGRRLEFVSPDVVYDFACDIFAPCAMGGVLNADTIPRLRCRAVVGAANNQLGTSEDADRLRVRDILYAPDYVVNIGGAMAIIGMEDMGWSPAQVEREVMRIGETLRKVFEQAALEDITTEAAARHRAEDKTIREWCQ
jgi:glutamate dehydrogenase/leucine dehydrogenase